MLDEKRLEIIAKSLGLSVTFDSEEPGVYTMSDDIIVKNSYDSLIGFFEKEPEQIFEGNSKIFTDHSEEKKSNKNFDLFTKDFVLLKSFDDKNLLSKTETFRKEDEFTRKAKKIMSTVLKTNDINESISQTDFNDKLIDDIEFMNEQKEEAFALAS